VTTGTRVAGIALGLAVVLAGLGILRGTLYHANKPTDLRTAFDAEFMTRPDGYAGLCRHYGMTFSAPPRQMDPGLMYRALADGAIDIIDAFATDGRIAAYALTVLEDDKRFFPPYQAAPLVRAETLRAHPELEPLLRSLGGRLSNAAMQQLNYEADERGRKARAIAFDFLVTERLLRPGAAPGDASAGTIRVGSKHFTEQEILGEIMALLIECRTDLAVERRLNLGGTMICFNALKAGDLDLYAEYTGTGLVNILDRDAVADPAAAYAAVRDAFAERFALLWLDPFGFDNTYTLAMRAGHAEALGLRTLSDLAAYMRKGAP
jgi:osmoprotectant transport system permease protein